MSHRKCTCACVRPRHQVCGSALMYPQNITSSISLNPSWTWWAWWSPDGEPGAENVHASAFPWLSEACEWLQSVTKLRSRTLTAPVAKWRAWLHQRRSRILNVLRGGWWSVTTCSPVTATCQAGLRMTVVRWAARSRIWRSDGCANVPGASRLVGFDTEQRRLENRGHLARAPVWLLGFSKRCLMFVGFSSKTMSGNATRGHRN